MAAQPQVFYDPHATHVLFAYDKRAAVVLSVLVLVEDVDHGGEEREEEGEDGDGDEELSGRREVSVQVELLLLSALARGHREGHLI